MAFHFIFTSIDSVKKENTFHFENLELLLLFFLLQFCCIILNACSSVYR
jgi:hypothetical protein